MVTQLNQQEIKIKCRFNVPLIFIHLVQLRINLIRRRHHIKLENRRHICYILLQKLQPHDLNVQLNQELVDVIIVIRLKKITEQLHAQNHELIYLLLLILLKESSGSVVMLVLERKQELLDEFDDFVFGETPLIFFAWTLQCLDKEINELLTKLYTIHISKFIVRTKQL